MKAGEEEGGVLAASLNSHARRVPWLWFPQKRLHPNLCLLIRTIHRSELIQVQLKARRKRKRKENILPELQEKLQKFVFLSYAGVVEGFQDKMARDQFKRAQLDLGFHSKVSEWQLKTLQGVSGVYRGSCDSPLAAGDQRRKQFLVTGMKDSPYKFSKCSSVSGKEDTNLPRNVIEK